MSALTWKPTPRQEEFASIPDSVFEALYGGAAGGGKSDLLMMLPAIKTTKQGKPLYTHPRFKMLFLRRTFPELDSEIVPRTKMYYPALGFNNYQDQKKRWTHSSGSIVQFGHCEHEKDVYKYDTSEYNIIAFDEATSFTPYQYEYLFARCRTSSTDLPTIIRSGSNPGNIGHSYFRKRFVEPCKQGGAILREKRTFQGRESTLLRIFIPSKATDNIHLMKADPDYLNKLDRLPEAERAAKRDGDWWTFSGQVFDDWRNLPFPDEPSWARHVIPEFRIPDYWPRVLSIDWGYSAKTFAGWYAINPCPDSRHPAKIVKYREYSCTKTKISVWAADIARLSYGETFSSVVLDPSAWGNRGDEQTIAQQVHNVLESSGMRIHRADNDRIGGKLLMQEYIRWRPRPARYVPQEGFDHETALRLERLSGPKAREEYENLFRPEPEETFLPKFQVFENCKETIETIPLCVYDKNRPEDVAAFDGDDPYDETRYGLKACQRYLEVGIEEYERDKEIAQVCSRLEQTGNMTGYYMEMANIEAREARSNLPLKRFHNPRTKFIRNW